MSNTVFSGYPLLLEQLEAITAQIPYDVTNLANASALLYQSLPDLNWAGFYRFQDGKLILGPFQGKTACTMIPMGKGVCGTAAQSGKVQRIADVHTFPGHIACDSASASEIVIPLYLRGQLWGVLDMDSPLRNRFSEEDEAGLKQFAHLLEQLLTGDY